MPKVWTNVVTLLALSLIGACSGGVASDDGVSEEPLQASPFFAGDILPFPEGGFVRRDPGGWHQANMPQGCFEGEAMRAHECHEIALGRSLASDGDLAFGLQTTHHLDDLLLGRLDIA